MSEKQELVDRAKELGLEVEDENGKSLTIAALKVAIAAAEQQEDDDEGVELPDDGEDEDSDDEDSDDEDSEDSEYIIKCTVMIQNKRLEPKYSRSGKPIPVRMTEAQAKPLVDLGQAVKV